MKVNMEHNGRNLSNKHTQMTKMLGDNQWPLAQQCRREVLIGRTNNQIHVINKVLWQPVQLWELFISTAP